MFAASFHYRKGSAPKIATTPLTIHIQKPTEITLNDQDISPVIPFDKSPKFLRLSSAGSIRNPYAPKLFNNETPINIGLKSTKSNTYIGNSPSSAQFRMDFTSAVAPYTQSNSNFSMSVYQTLKDQKKFFLTATSPKHSRMGSTSMATDQSQTTKLIITDKNFSIVQETPKKPPKNDKVSPRKRLALQGPRVYSTKKTTLKDLLMESQSMPVSPPAVASTTRANSSSPKKAAQMRRESHLKKLKEITEARAKQAEKEEAIVIQAIEKNAEKGFNKTMDLYNKYYTGYFFEPTEKFKSKQDLKIKTDLFVSPNNFGADGSPLMHTLNTPKFKKNLKHQTTNVSFSGDFRLDSNRGGMPSDRSPKIKSPFMKAGTKNFKLQPGDSVVNDNLFDVQDKTDQVVQRIFADGMDQIRSTVDNLQRVQDLLHSKGTLTPEEEQFLHYVKEGKIATVDGMLKKNPDLVLTRDGRNLTALHWAVKRRHVKLVEVLCRSGADICARDMVEEFLRTENNQINKVGRMPTDIAKRFNEPMIEQILEFAKEEQISRNRNKFRHTGAHGGRQFQLIARENRTDNENVPIENL